MLFCNSYFICVICNTSSIRHYLFINVMKNGKVKNVQANGTWEGQYGLMYKFEVEFENGDSGQYLSKSQNQTKFVIGQETSYEYTGGKYPKVKPVSNFQQNSTSPKNEKREEYIIKQNALTNACNIVGESDVHKIIDIAEIFSKWVLTGEKPQQQKNDLPF